MFVFSPDDNQRSTLTNVTQSGDSQRSASALLSNVSMDTDMSFDLTDSSIDISDLDTSMANVNRARPVTEQHAIHNNDMELESVASSRATTAGSARARANKEPLMPAKLKPAKEKNANHTKEVESGEKLTKKSPTSPTKPKTLNFNSKRRDSSDSSTDEEYATPSVESMPLPGEKVPQVTKTAKPVPSQTSGQPQNARSSQTTTAGHSRKSAQPVAKTTNSEQQQPPSQPHNTRTKQFEAFYVDTEHPSINGPPSSRPGTSHSATSQTPTQQSFVLHQQQSMTSDQARAAGIPVIDGSAHSRSSNHQREEQDREIQKINADNRDKELNKQGLSDSFYLNPDDEPSSAGQRPDSLNVRKVNMESSRGSQADDKPSPKTSFAQIKRQKDNGEMSPILYTQKTPPQRGALKVINPISEQPKSSKKTTFAALPNQTTWQESVQKKADQDDANKSTGGTESIQPLPSELHVIRMRLEERRRQIETEKRRIEIQWNKQRQRVGKQAFIQVISRGKSEETSPSEGEPGMLENKAREGWKEPSAQEKMAALEHQRKRLEEARALERLKEAEAEKLREAERLQVNERLREEERLRIEAEKKKEEEWLQEEKARKEAEERMKEAAKAHEEERAKQMERAKYLERQREPQREREAIRSKEEEIRSKEEEKQKEASRIRDAERDIELQKEKLRQLLLVKEEEYERDRREGSDRSSSDRESTRSRIERIRTNSRNSESDDDRRERSKKSFSREDIQETIDSVKNKWGIGNGENSLERRKKRPMSYAGSKDEIGQVPGVMSLSDHVERDKHQLPERSVDDTARESTHKGVDYGNSLDRLNSSLSELQGEIMKLSVQQDKIKKNRMQTPPSSVRSMASPPRDGRYYGEPDLAEGQRGSSSSRSSTPSSQGSHATSQPSHMVNQNVMMPADTSQMVSQAMVVTGPTLPMYGQPNMPYQQPAPAPMYGVQQPAYIQAQYGPHHPYQSQPVQTSQGHVGPFPMAFPGSPALYQQQMYGAALSQSGGFGGQSQWHTPVPQMGYGAAMTNTSQHQGLPLSGIMQPMASTHTVTAHQTLQSPTAMAPTHELYAPHPDMGVSAMSNSSTSLPSPHSPTQHRGSPDSYGNGPPSPGLHSSDLTSPSSGPSWLHRPLGDVKIEGSSEGEPESTTSASPPPPAAPNQGFFVSFENSSPRRIKPKLNGGRSKDLKSSKDDQTTPGPPPITANVNSPSSAVIVAGGSADEVRTLPRPSNPPKPPDKVEIPVGFVIEVETNGNNEVRLHSSPTKNKETTKTVEY